MANYALFQKHQPGEHLETFLRSLDRRYPNGDGEVTVYGDNQGDRETVYDALQAVAQEAEPGRLRALSYSLAPPKKQDDGTYLPPSEFFDDKKVRYELPPMRPGEDASKALQRLPVGWDLGEIDDSDVAAFTAKVEDPAKKNPTSDKTKLNYASVMSAYTRKHLAGRRAYTTVANNATIKKWNEIPNRNKYAVGEKHANYALFQKHQPTVYLETFLRSLDRRYPDGDGEVTVYGDNQGDRKTVYDALQAVAQEAEPGRLRALLSYSLAPPKKQDDGTYLPPSEFFDDKKVRYELPPMRPGEDASKALQRLPVGWDLGEIDDSDVAAFTAKVEDPAKKNPTSDKTKLNYARAIFVYTETHLAGRMRARPEACVNAINYR